MKNGKSEFIKLMSRAIAAVLVICACLLGGGAPASGQTPGNAKVEEETKKFTNAEFGNFGTLEETTKKTGPGTRTVTRIFKDPEGKERAREDRTITPDLTYGKDGIKIVFTLKTDSGKHSQVREAHETEGRPVTMEGEELRDSYGAEKSSTKREEKITFTYPGQGKRRTEIFRKYDKYQIKIDESITRIDASGEEISFEESKYEEGKLVDGFIVNKQVYGFKRYIDKQGKKHTERYNPETKKYEDVPENPSLLGTGISAPPTDTTASSDTFKRNEIVFGFSLIREDSDPDDFNTYGLFSSYTRNLNKSFGLTGGFSANFRERGGVDLSKYTLTGGVTVLPFHGANGDDRMRAFVHALAGISRLSAQTSTAGFTDSTFAAQFTGGLDIDLNQHLFIRPVEAGFAPTHFNGRWQGNRVFRFAFGLRF